MRRPLVILHPIPSQFTEYEENFLFFFFSAEEGDLRLTVLAVLDDEGRGGGHEEDQDADEAGFFHVCN